MCMGSRGFKPEVNRQGRVTEMCVLNMVKPINAAAYLYVCVPP